MMRGAIKRGVKTELASYALLAALALALAVVAPGFVDVPNWAVLAFLLISQVGLYRYFYGRW